MKSEMVLLKALVLASQVLQSGTQITSVAGDVTTLVDLWGAIHDVSSDDSPKLVRILFNVQ